MKPNRRIILIALAAIAIVAGRSAREERRSPCASGACRLPLLPTDNTWSTGAPAAIASTNATPQPATGAPRRTPQE
jgi:hypothetical protein